MQVNHRINLKYLSFVERDPEGRKTKVYSVQARGIDIPLGYVRFRPQWRCYVFHPENHTLFDFKCLTDLTDFLQAQNTEWRRSL